VNFVWIWSPLSELRVNLVLLQKGAQRPVNVQASVVFNQAQLAKAIHEIADLRSRGANHFGQGSMADMENGCFGSTGLTKMTQPQE